MSNAPYPIRETLSSSELHERDFLVIANRVHYPDIPSTPLEDLVDLAKRVLGLAIRRESHHEHIRRAMQEWGNEQRESDDGPGYYREFAFKFSPRERNMGVIEGDTDEELRKKAMTVIAWAEDQYGERAVDEIRGAQLRDARNAWRDEIEAAHEQRDIDHFRKDPPAEINGWVQIPTRHPHVEVAYQSNNHGTPSIAAIFENEQGELDAKEFTLKKWVEASGDPTGAQHWNRPILRVTKDTSVWADLRTHLRTFDADPPSRVQRYAIRQRNATPIDDKSGAKIDAVQDIFGEAA